MPSVWLAENGDYWQARWTDRFGNRRAKSLGSRKKVSEREAKRLCTGIAFKLSTGEIASGDRAPRLEEFIEQYVRLRSELSPGTVYAARNTGSYLMAYFGPDIRIDKIAQSDALEWIAAMRLGKLFEARKILLKTRATTKLSEATIAKQARTAKTMFQFAIDQLEYITKNPFRTLRSKAPTPSKDWKQVSRDDLTKVMEACPNDGWRSLFALCRLAGLRRGEALGLEWADVDFARNRIEVNARISRTTTKKARRTCPIEPERLPAGLAGILEAVKRSGSKSPCAGVQVDDIDRDAKRILAASVGVYAKPFHTLRKCFEGELARKYPRHYLKAWIGHSEEVADEHYLRVEDEDFQKPGREQSRVQTELMPPGE